MNRTDATSFAGSAFRAGPLALTISQMLFAETDAHTSARADRKKQERL
jgi:hypothetical protein